uniref:Glutathione synthetaseic-like n=1 Tax=Rhizophora mucronata TaxID=61149 RepID=A0A2P2LUV3_RHIMU
MQVIGKNPPFHAHCLSLESADRTLTQVGKKGPDVSELIWYTVKLRSNTKPTASLAMIIFQKKLHRES